MHVHFLHNLYRFFPYYLIVFFLVRLALVSPSLFSRMHLPPESWGPFFWHTIHIAALGYPSKPSYAQKNAAKDFFESLKFLIPCPVCRDHYSKYMEILPLIPHLDSRDDLFKWTVLLHNEVNKMLNKPEYTQAQALSYYSRLGQRGRSPVWTLDDFVEADWKARAQGVATGIGVASIAYGIYWMMNN